MNTTILPGRRRELSTLREIRAVVHLWDRLTPGQGRPLSERVAESAGAGGFLFEFALPLEGRNPDQGEEWVFGYYPSLDTGRPEYALSVIGGRVAGCNCPDAMCRRRLCKHAVHLAILGGFTLRLPPVAVGGGTVMPAADLPRAADVGAAARYGRAA